MRKVLSLLLGSAAVVGFESTFGLAKPFMQPDYSAPRMAWTGSDTLDDILMCRPGGIIRVRSPQDIQINAARQILKAIDCKGKRITHVIHGYARGADYGGMMYGRDWLNAEVIGFKANWFADGKAAGPLRNQRMIDEGNPDVAIAFPGGRGTADMTRRCEAAGVPIVRAEL